MEAQIDKQINNQTKPRIQLSLVACRFLKPYMPNVIDEMQMGLASRIMDKMIKGKSGELGESEDK